MNTTTAAAPLGTVVWDAAHPVPRRTKIADALRALGYHYYRAVVIGH